MMTAEARVQVRSRAHQSRDDRRHRDAIPRELGAQAIGKPTSANLLAQHTAAGEESPPLPPIDAMFTMRPPPWRRMCRHGGANQMERTVEVDAHAALEVLDGHVLLRRGQDLSRVVRPARRCVPTARSADARRCSASSADVRLERVDVRAIRAQFLRRFGQRRACRAREIATCAPSAVNRRASTSPSPRDAPVINTVCPSKL